MQQEPTRVAAELENGMEKAMAPHSSTLAWNIPRMEEAWHATVHGIAKSQTQFGDETFKLMCLMPSILLLC